MKTTYVAMAPLLCSLAWGADGVRLLQDTAVELRLKQSISSAEARVNDRVEFEVIDDVTSGGVTVIRKGAPAWGVVTAASPRARMARSGRIELDIQAVCLADGSRAPLRAHREQNGGGLLAAGESPGDSLLALPALPVLLFLYGKDVTIPKDRELTVFIGEDVELERARIESPAAGAACGAVPGEGAVEAHELATVNVASDPSGAEIGVDGRYAGNTPSMLRLPGGDHRITITLAGRKAWDRIVAITPGGQVSVNAALEPSRPAIARKETYAEPAIQ